MKLYTEEQVLNSMLSMKTYIEKYDESVIDTIVEKHLKSLGSIEIPSDEEIKKIMELDGMEFDEFDPYDVSYLGGACWMRNKIQGGEQ
jgi:Leu/Phe-tRNA-protein transferase